MTTLPVLPLVGGNSSLCHVPHDPFLKTPAGHTTKGVDESYAANAREDAGCTARWCTPHRTYTKVPGCRAVKAARSQRIVLRCILPCVAFPLNRLPALCRFSGQIPAHDAKCLALGKMDIRTERRCISVRWGVHVSEPAWPKAQEMRSFCEKVIEITLTNFPLLLS
jgi:hypothetical protein